MPDVVLELIMRSPLEIDAVMQLSKLDDNAEPTTSTDDVLAIKHLILLDKAGL